MNKWLSFLQSNNARFQSDNEAFPLILDFGDVATERQTVLSTQAVVSELSHYGIIQVSGDDADDFLQNQLSNDIKTLDPQHSQLSAHCNAKGRVISLLRVVKLPNGGFYLIVPMDRLGATLKRLQMFVLRSQVQLTDKSEQLALVGYRSNSPVAPLKKYFDACGGTDDCYTDEGITAVRLSGDPQRLLLITSNENMISLWPQLTEQAIACGHRQWMLLDIQNGIPEVFDSNSEAFVPQMLNLHSVNGVSFSKGCYPGQEVVARMHFLGKLKRRMYLAQIQDTQLPPISADVVKADDGSAVGKIVNAAMSSDDTATLLLVLQIANENDTLKLQTAEGPQVQLKELPYSVELERTKQ